jgi:hypothetical protein
MSNTFYPQFDADMLLPIKLALTSISEDPLWLERPDCPYEKEVSELLWAMWLTFRTKPRQTREVSSGEGGAGENAIGVEDKWRNVADELTELFNGLKEAKEDTLDMEVKEKLNYYRVATSLLEKITGLGERAMNVRAVSEFQAKVLSVFDEVLTPEQRTRAMEKLAQ